MLVVGRSAPTSPAHSAVVRLRKPDSTLATTAESRNLSALRIPIYREILVNAIAHADDSLTGMRIQIAIYSDRMEIQNPGMLPFGMTMDDFKAGVSKIRNRVIARVLRKLGLMKEWGSGYMRVLEALSVNLYFLHTIMNYQGYSGVRIFRSLK